jgi:hypothetical protein
LDVAYNLWFKARVAFFWVEFFQIIDQQAAFESWLPS